MSDNPYRNQPMYSRDVCQLMRDINGLEAEVVSGTANSMYSATDGSYLYVIADRSTSVKVFDVSDGSYSTAWNLPAFAYDDERNVSINYDAGSLYVVRSRQYTYESPVFSTTALVLTAAGTLTNSVTVAADSRLGTADGTGIYTCGLISGDTTRFKMRKWSYTGSLLWTTDPQDYQLGFSGFEGVQIYVNGNAFAFVSGGVWFAGYTIAEFQSVDGTLSFPRRERDFASLLGSFVSHVKAANGYYFGTGRTQGFGMEYFDNSFEYDSTVGDSLPSGTGTTLFRTMCTDYSNYIYLIAGAPNDYYLWKVDISDDSTVIDGTSLTLSWGGQTEWYAYGTRTRESLGVPDGGVSIPDLEGLTNAESPGTVLGAKHLTDMRAAVQNLAPYYENSVTSNAFNWTAASADNLYYVAMGDRSDYGATSGARYDWTHSASELIGNPCYDIDIGEIYECVEKLKASDPV